MQMQEQLNLLLAQKDLSFLSFFSFLIIMKNTLTGKAMLIG